MLHIHSIIILLCLLVFKAHALPEDNTRFCERDCRMEYQLFRKYAQQGSSLANLSMAIMNFQGHGRDINIDLANQQLLKAARAEEPAAMYQLAYNLMYGLYITQDLNRSLIWFKRANKFKVLNSNEFVVVLNKFLNSEESPIRASIEKALNKKVSIEETIFVEKDDNESIELITVRQPFYWTFVLYNAQLQTCTVNCELGSLNIMIPLIHIANEQALLDELKKI